MWRALHVYLTTDYLAQGPDPKKQCLSGNSSHAPLCSLGEYLNGQMA